MIVIVCKSEHGIEMMGQQGEKGGVEGATESQKKTNIQKC